MYVKHRHDLFYITMKYHLNIPNGVQVIERTQIVYGRTDRRRTDARVIATVGG